MEEQRIRPVGSPKNSTLGEDFVRGPKNEAVRESTMKRGARFQIVCIICVCGLAIILSIGLFAANDRGTEAKQHTPDKDRAAIETLHRLDVQTTLTDKADELAKLWDADAVRIQPGSPAEVTKA